MMPSSFGENSAPFERQHFPRGSWQHKDGGFRSAYSLPEVQHGHQVGRGPSLGAYRFADGNAGGGAPITTMMISGIPPHITREQFVQQLDACGLSGTYDFFYMPTGILVPGGGLAFVNFIDANFASLCKWIFDGHQCDGTASAAPVQGLENNMETFADVENAADMPFLVSAPTPSQSALECLTAMMKAKQSPTALGIRQQFRKTKMCIFHLRNRCAQGKYCPFAHDGTEIQAPPNLLKTKLCVNFFNSKRRCNDSMCKFAHGYSELRSTETVYKTELCRQWLGGRCKLGHACRHAHGVEELRDPKAVASLSQWPVFQPETQDLRPASTKAFPPPAPRRSYSAVRRWLDGGGDDGRTQSTLSVDAEEQTHLTPSDVSVLAEAEWEQYKIAEMEQELLPPPAGSYHRRSGLDQLVPSPSDTTTTQTVQSSASEPPMLAGIGGSREPCTVAEAEQVLFPADFYAPDAGVDKAGMRANSAASACISHAMTSQEAEHASPESPASTVLARLGVGGYKFVPCDWNNSYEQI